MYIGRIVCVAMTGDGRLCASYRVSSRSFPNRTAVIGADKVSIVPKEGHEGDIHKNPYIAYNCVRLVCGWEVAVVSNGTQTDPIAEKIALGIPPRDAIAGVLKSLDPRERVIVQGHFGLSSGRTQTLDEIGRQLGISKERVRQIEQRALRKMRSAMGERGAELLAG